MATLENLKILILSVTETEYIEETEDAYLINCKQFHKIKLLRDYKFFLRKSQKILVLKP